MNTTTRAEPSPLIWDVDRLVDPFDVPCTYCGSVAGQQCLNRVNGLPLARFLAHPVRIRNAKEAGSSAVPGAP